MNGALEAASLPTASARGLVTAPLALPLEPAEGGPLMGTADVAALANRLALGLAAGLVAVLVHGEVARLSSQELTWRALLGR
jgi:hypothetical protein